MATLPKGLTQADLNRYAKLDAGIKKLTDEKNELGTLIKEKVTKVGTYIWDKVVVKRTQAKTKDIAGAQKRYPREDYPALYTVETVYTFNWEALTEAQQEEHTKIVERLSVDVSK